MHFTPRPRWLMIVSTAMVVLPVLRSPMISSRWPRPIGVIVSMTLIPVCSASCTGWRLTIPGAWISRRRSSVSPIGPCPSIGSPRGLTTRPSSPSPTGTERMRPVERTTWPSSRPSTSPSTTAPIDSSSRLSASPSVPFSNSSSSFTEAWGRPLTRAIPSPTSITRPTCSAPTWRLSSAMCRERAAAISSPEKVSSAIFAPSPSTGLYQQVAQPLEPQPHRAVDDEIAEGDQHPADHVGVDHLAHLDGAVDEAAEGGGEAGALGVLERHGEAALGHPPAPLQGGQLHQPLEGPDEVAHVPGT